MTEAERSAPRKAGRIWTTSFMVMGVGILFSVSAIWFGWFAREPTWHGRTVTGWLDRLVLYELQTTQDGVAVVDRAPELVAHDPALKALLRIGSNAVPALVERIMERAQWDDSGGFRPRAKLWMQWIRNRVRGGRDKLPTPDRWPEFQRRRKDAAGYVLVILGTNTSAGFGRFMEAYAAAPKHESIARTPVPGPPVGAHPNRVARMVKKTHPQRRQEMVAEISRGFQHTNAWCRVVALECVLELPEELGGWKKDLLRLTSDKDSMVREAALGQLLNIVQIKERRAVVPASDIWSAANAVVEDTNASQRVRELAGIARKLAEGK